MNKRLTQLGLFISLSRIFLIFVVTILVLVSVVQFMNDSIILENGDSPFPQNIDLSWIENSARPISNITSKQKNSLKELSTNLRPNFVDAGIELQRLDSVLDQFAKKHPNACNIRGAIRVYDRMNRSELWKPLSGVCNLNLFSKHEALNVLTLPSSLSLNNSYTFWYALIGDSISRRLFFYLIETVLGSEIVYSQSNFTRPQDYHSPRVTCCKKDATECIFQVLKDGSNVADHVNGIISNSPTKFSHCFSWDWHKGPDDELVSKIISHQRANILAVNTGLHPMLLKWLWSLEKYTKGLEKVRQAFINREKRALNVNCAAKVSCKVPSLTIIHDITSTRESELSSVRKNALTNAAISQWNKSIYNIFSNSSNQSPTPWILVESNVLSSRAYGIDTIGDGLHWNNRFAALVTQIHMNLWRQQMQI